MEHSLRTGWQTFRKHWEGTANIGENKNKQNHTSFLGGILQISNQKEETPIIVTETFALKLVRIMKSAV
jgi:hypothetical protein